MKKVLFGVCYFRRKNSSNIADFKQVNFLFIIMNNAG